MRESESIFSQNRNEAGDIFTRVIQTGDRVAVIGPSLSARFDATFLYVSHLLQFGGEVLVVDPRSESHHVAWFSVARSDAGRVQVASGLGNIDRYRGELGVFSEHESICTPVWLGTESTAQHIYVDDRTIDCVVDHDASVYIATNLASQSEGKFRDNLEEIFRELNRVLRFGGRAIVQADNAKSRLGKLPWLLGGSYPLANLLSTCGFAVEYYSVSDVVRIPVSQESRDWLMSIKKDATGLWSDIHLYWQYLREERGQWWLVFDRPHHPSPDLYLATKVR